MTALVERDLDLEQLCSKCMREGLCEQTQPTNSAQFAFDDWPSCLLLQLEQSHEGPAAYAFQIIFLLWLRLAQLSGISAADVVSESSLQQESAVATYSFSGHRD